MRSPIVLLIGVMLIAVSATAQVIELPARPSRLPFGGGRPLDPSRSRQELALNIDALGGFDDNLAPDSSEAQVFTARPSGYTGFSNLTLRYFAGGNVRSFEISGSSYMNSYRNVGLTPNYGGNLNVHVQSALGRRAQLDVSQATSYDPYFSLGAFGVLPSDSGARLLDASPTVSLTETRSWSNDVAANLNVRAAQDQTLGVAYHFNKRTYQTGAAFDSQTQDATGTYVHALGRTSGLTASYHHTDATSKMLTGLVLPLRNHGLDLGFRYGRDLSRTRRVSFTLGGGAVYVDTKNNLTLVRLTYWTPSAYGTARLDFSRSWTVTADYRRDVSVIQGLRPQPFSVNAARIGVGGFLASRLEGSLIAAYSNGQAGQIDPVPGRFDSYTATAQLRFAITPSASATVSYSRYRYQLNAAASQNLAILPRMDRNAIRVGFSVGLKLLQTYLDQSGHASGGSK